jgi:hypothetical protein
MKSNKKFKTGLLICFISLSLIGFAVPTKATNRVAYIKKYGEYLLGIWWPGWYLELDIIAHRSFDYSCDHYYFTNSHTEEYTDSSAWWIWTEYSEDADYSYCYICHRITEIAYEVHGRFAYFTDSSNYYDITLAIEFYASSDTIYATFGPFYNELEGTWTFYESSGIET